LLILISAVTLFAHWPLSAELPAAALIVPLPAGIRNAGDMTLWIITRCPTRGAFVWLTLKGEPPTMGA